MIAYRHPMRVFISVIGAIGLFGLACLGLVYGLMAFTPTTSCQTTSSGACANGAFALKLILIGYPLTVIATGFGTWGWTGNGPRAWVPYLGILILISLFWWALSTANAG